MSHGLDALVYVDTCTFVVSDTCWFIHWNHAVPLGILTKFVVLNFLGGYSNNEFDIQHSHLFSWGEAAEIRCSMALVGNWISTLYLFFFRFDGNTVWQRWVKL